MRRLLAMVAVAVLVALPVYAQGTGSAQAEKPGKSMTANGSVTSVSGDTLTIKAKSGEMTFNADPKVKVTGTGASTKTAELKAAKKTPTLADYLKNGDMVTVTYHEMDGKMMATAVRIMSAMK